MSAGSVAEEMAMFKAISVGRFLIFLAVGNCVDITLPVENAHHAQGFRLNDVENEHILEILHGPETQPGKGNRLATRGRGRRQGRERRRPGHWGAFPGHTLADVQSGMGLVHNTFLFERAERTVVEAPFRPFPRNLLSGAFSLLPRPPWFITNRKGAILGKLLVAFQYRPSFLKMPRIFLNALLG